MTIKQLILQNLKKNVKHYYLYVFALVFTVALYFAFVTLQYDPAIEETGGTMRGAAAIGVASVLLVVIVAVFLLYANNIFIKRRSKEIALFQLIGMTKGKIVRILSTENFILYVSSLVIGIFAGFAFSRLIMLIFLKITGVEAEATLRFSEEALGQTLLVFGGIYLLIIAMNAFYIKRQTILSLFRATSSTETQATKRRKVSLLQMTMGAVGIGLIVFGYVLSQKLFSGEIPNLFAAMLLILATVIVGTYLFYRSSISFIGNLIRKQKGGYLTVQEVLSLSSIMFKMKTNSLLLTIITTVSALAIGLLSLSYISYYSAEQMAENSVPSHFAFSHAEEADTLKATLDRHGIAYDETVLDVIQVRMDVETIVDTNIEALYVDPSEMTLPVVRDIDVEGVDLSSEETVFSGYSNILESIMPLKDAGDIELHGLTESIPQSYVGLNDESILPWFFTGGGLPVAIVDQSVYDRLLADLDPELQYEMSTYVGIDITEASEHQQANDLYNDLNFSGDYRHESQLDELNTHKQNMGLLMFIVGFLGLTFLITSGCILYFKQMDESEEEKPNYTILRKLGFTQHDLMKGIQMKQLFTFGIPLIVGLSHSYFAVQSGWFIFGMEVWTPMLLVMGFYTALYSVFGILSVLYYKRVIKEAL
ncbi:ABC transporter permease [Halalkalibacter okhensis]|uniref:Bacitracin ABC transporter permease n=1 Tax=Halalkalibacter okhensis TaxID=333138 RepID=A0A0B0IHI8_9BACI|nr:ABC transporter permease [Halalkalibacter okhensis]KHF39131.1 bacitracin ABC transporter permease [Halalkalibacter okhensis]